ncbi:hypothetical protein MSPP1_003451 [Malassezia sp. CBS 17886]|nr:hypothetical protein MSPP1_003451 [Malassezia sp. CBS 17886]
MGSPLVGETTLRGTDEGTCAFPTVAELRHSVRKLERELVVDRADEPLSGRIIHVAQALPFSMQPAAEVDFHHRKEERAAATDTVALLAQAARARRAEQEARAVELAHMEEQRRLQVAQMQHPSTGAPRRSQLWASRRPSGTSGMRSAFLDNNLDLESKLLENQERSRRLSGRRAWMMTEVVDDTSEASEDDRFSPLGSRRSSRHAGSFGSIDGELPTWSKLRSGVSDYNSPASASGSVEDERAPLWSLALRSGHSSLNSGIYSLCATHAQTYIGWAGDVRFAAHAKDDDRTDASELTAAERAEIEAVLASLEDRSLWSFHENGLEMGSMKRAAQEDTPKAGIRYVPVWLDYRTAHAHYEGYCKSTLWPLFHYLLWRDDCDRSKWDQYSWEAYVAVNQAFAERVVAEYRAGDIVWVHDYHLVLVPQMVRKRIPQAHIGLFLHSSFPSSELFRCLPQRNEVIEGMLGTDLTCFQNRPYARHFISCCVRIGGFEVQGNSVESFHGRVTHVSYSPMGIDVERVRHDSNAPGVVPKMGLLRDLYADKRIVVGCDKLDVVRGVIQKLQAFYHLLLNYPCWRERVVLIQVTIPAMNSSARLEREVSELVNQINGDFGSLSFTPVHHYHQMIERDDYYALLSVADLALVTSVRDGMNTMSMEYVMCQDKHARNPIILSEFTGTAGRLRDAIRINPWDIDGVAAAIDLALCLPAAEKYARHERCYAEVVSQTSHTWALSLVQQMLLRLRHRYSAHSTPAFDRALMMRAFSGARKRLLLLDYDGTMTRIVKDPECAVPSARLLHAMAALARDERNVIYIISGRDEHFLAKHFAHLSTIGLSAEHGSYFKEHGPGTTWQNLSAELDMSWKSDVLNVFRYYTDRTVGSNIEEKKSSIVWHYRMADPDFGSFQAKECQALLDNIMTQNDLPVEVVVGKKNVEVRPLAINKGEIVHRILYANPDTEFVFCAGDDKTDEDMFRFLSSLTPVAGDASARSTPDQTPARPLDSIALAPPAPLNRAAAAHSPKRPHTIRLRKEHIFTVTVGPRSKKTLASRHVGDVDDIIGALCAMGATEHADLCGDAAHGGGAEWGRSDQLNASAEEHLEQLSQAPPALSAEHRQNSASLLDGGGTRPALSTDSQAASA